LTLGPMAPGKTAVASGAAVPVLRDLQQMPQAPS
jgi:hypothetical protein